MPKQEGQKSKLLTLLRILEQKTDEEHLLNVPQLVELLEQQDILAERKSIYSDIDTLRSLGYDIQLRRGRGGGYWLASRTFELSELKLLVDAVQASKVVSARTSSKLIHKLEALCSDYEAPSCSVRCTWMAAPKATATPCFTASMRCTAPSMRAEWCGSATRTTAPAPSARGSWHGKTAATTLSLIRTRKSLRASATTAWTACLP